MDQIFCQVRKEWVAAQPEERVRQHLVKHLIQDLGFPSSYICLEKGLRQMPHLNLLDQEVPDRRADIVCFASGIHPKYALYPLLLIECKAVKLTPKVLSQVVGYNHFMQAHYIAAANQTDVQFGWYDSAKKDYAYIPYIPLYKDLLSNLPLISVVNLNVR